MEVSDNQQTARIFTARTANDWISEAASRPDPISLWHNLWFEHEVACLFADTNIGKSIYAIQMADSISQRHKVLYFDFEMSDKQFQMRYTDPVTGSHHRFNDNFIRVEFARTSFNDSDLEMIIRQISLVVEQTGAKILIIDNISWLCNRSESGDAAGILMQMLIDLKRRMGLSILVLAHTPKRNTMSPLTQNSLAGSKRLANFMDSMFAIGMSRVNRPYGRYIKQIKVRSSEMEYGEDNVITAEIVKDGDYIELRHIGNAGEREMLCEERGDKADTDELRRKVRDCIARGMSYRETAAETGLSTSKVYRLVKSGEGEGNEGNEG